MHFWTTEPCGPFPPEIRVPNWVVASLDDPLGHPGCSAGRRRASPWLPPTLLPCGGHVAFFTGGLPWRPERRAEGQAMEFLAARLRTGEPTA